MLTAIARLRYLTDVQKGFRQQHILSPTQFNVILQYTFTQLVLRPDSRTRHELLNCVQLWHFYWNKSFMVYHLRIWLVPLPLQQS